jgi:hypothetical protein
MAPVLPIAANGLAYRGGASIAATNKMSAPTCPSPASQATQLTGPWWPGRVCNGWPAGSLTITQWCAP